MQRALDPRAVVVVELAHALRHIVDRVGGDFAVVQDDFILDEARGRHASQVQNHLEQIVFVAIERV